MFLTPKNGSCLRCDPRWNVSVPPFTSRKTDFQSHEKTGKRTVTRTAPRSGGLANSRVCLPRPLAGPCLQPRSHSQGLCLSLCLFLSTFSSLGKNMPSPQGHSPPRQSSMSGSVSPGWPFHSFLHFSLDALMMTGISDPIHFPSDLAPLCGTVVRNKVGLHLFAVRSLPWCRLAPFLLGVSRGKEARVWKGLCFFLISLLFFLK